jgi:uncharacterized cupin superfamily protein
MDIRDVPFTVTDWEAVEPVEHRGETGSSFWRTLQAGAIRVRTVTYSPGYRSDHWCPKGHVFLVLEGEFGLAFQDGRTFLLGPGMSFQAGEDAAHPHLGFSEKGAKAFIVD